MSNELVKTQDFSAIENVLINGDLSKLTSEQRVKYLNAVCSSLGLNPLTKPFEFITLNGRLVMYAKKDATDQLRKVNRVSIRITDRAQIGDAYVVKAQATLPDGREDEGTGAVNLAGLKGDAYANALMKAETKAKRRVTLSICGLGFLDETEVEDIPAKDKSFGIHPEQPGDGNGNTEPLYYTIPFGKFARRTLEEIDPKQLGDYVLYLENSAKKKGVELQGQVLDFVNRAADYLAAMENGVVNE